MARHAMEGTQCVDVLERSSKDHEDIEEVLFVKHEDSDHDHHVVVCWQDASHQHSQAKW